MRQTETANRELPPHTCPSGTRSAAAAALKKIRGEGEGEAQE